MEEIMTLQDAAKVLKVSVSHARGMVRRGELPASRVGQRLIRIDSRAVQEYLGAHPARPVKV